MLTVTKDELYESLEEKKYPNGVNNYLVRKKGTSHIASGSVCQDYCVTDSVDNILISAVADGHGGEAYEKSDIGSRLACEQLVDLVKRTYNESVNRKCEEQFIRALKGSEFKKIYLQKWKEAVLRDFTSSCDDEDITSASNVLVKYGTTLLYTIITENWIVCGQIGDGAILLFNENGVFQLHRRSGYKVGSQTPSSLCSSRAKYSIMIEAYKRKLFNNILLSTDGIYDKLAINDSFYRYAIKLSDKAKKGEFSQNPFHIINNGKEIDLHILSKDDCTLSLISMDQSIKMPLYNKGALSEFTDIVFVRNIGEYCYFNAYKDGLKYSIHSMTSNDYVKEVNVTGDGSFTIIKSIKTIITDEGESYIIYPIYEKAIELSLLIESYENLEKSFTDYKGKYNNNFWLSTLQKIERIESIVKEDNICFSDLQYQVISVDDNGHLLLYDDGFVPFSENQEAKDVFDSYSSIIGKIIINESEIPLFAPNPNGQAVPFVFRSEKLRLCRTLLNVQNGDIWLENLSDYKWIIGNNKTKVVDPNHYLRLSGNKKISFQIGTEIIDAQIIMF